MKRTPTTCTVCGNGREDPWHLINECLGSADDPTLATRRSEARTSARLMLLELTGRIAEADPSLAELAETARRAMAAMAWTSDEGRWVLFRLMAVLPFTAAAAAPGHAAVAALGALFDACRLDGRRLAPVAQTWVKWAVQHSHSLGKARTAAAYTLALDCQWHWHSGWHRQLFMNASIQPTPPKIQPHHPHRQLERLPTPAVESGGSRALQVQRCGVRVALPMAPRATGRCGVTHWRVDCREQLEGRLLPPCLHRPGDGTAQPPMVTSRLRREPSPERASV